MQVALACMPMARPSALRLFFFFALLLLSGASAGSKRRGGWYIKAIYNLRDSISDTGNLLREGTDGSFSPIKRLPYGMTTFHRPTGRCSDGHLMIEYLGSPWTEEEHRMFLIGLQKLGRGNWRGISRNFVVTRTPSQVASHAQRHFIRQTNSNKRKRTSVFDIVAHEAAVVPYIPMSSQVGLHVVNQLPPAPVPFTICFTPHVSVPIPCWPGYGAVDTVEKTHKVLRPTAMHSKAPINVNELVDMSKLSLEESNGETGPSSLSQKLLSGSDGRSAFQAKQCTSGPRMD